MINYYINKEKGIVVAKFDDEWRWCFSNSYKL